jgi:hypothetical protein
MTIGEYATVDLRFFPLSKEDRKRSPKSRQDGEHIGRLVDGMDTKWHVYRHKDGILVCWQYIDKDYDDPTEPMRIVTNTTDVNELWRYLPR